MAEIELEAILIPLAFFSLIGFIIGIQVRRANRRMAAQFQVCSQMLDKVSSGEDLSRFFETESGRRVIEFLTAADRDANRGVLRVMQSGIVISTLGPAFFIIAAVVGDVELMIPGILGLMLGGGLIASALVARKLGEKWATKSRGIGSTASDPYRIHEEIATH